MVLRGITVALAAAGQPPGAGGTAELTPRQRRMARRQKQHAKQRELRQQEQPARLEREQAVEQQRAAAAEELQQLHVQLLQQQPDLPLNCPHFASCSGCDLQSGLAAPPLLASATRFFAERCAYPGFRLAAGPAQQWRRRARLAVRRGDDGEAVVGLFSEGSHDAVDIPDCVAHHPAINAAVSLLREALTACGVEPYHEASGKGELRYLQLTVVQPPAPAGSQDGGQLGAGGAAAAGGTAAAVPAQVQLVLVWNAAAGEVGDAADERLSALSDWLWQRQQHGEQQPGSLLHSIWANFQPAATNTILGEEWRLLRGAEVAWARLGGVDICYGPGSFMQANFGAMDAALAAIQAHVPAGATVADLHAGVGTIGLSLAATRAPRWVRFVEINGQGEPPFQQSAERLRASAAGAPPLEYLVGAAGSQPGRWCKGAEVVVLDPPRKGCEPALLRYLCSDGAAAAGVRRVLYLSCGLPALQRDAAALLDSGRWRLAHAEAFLFFPGADHLETLCVFDKIE